AMQKADEERGVKAHGTGGIEQNDEAQRFDLAPPPGEVDGRPTVRDVAVNGAAQVEPPAAPAYLVAPDEPRTHAAGKTCRERVRRGHVLRVDDMAHVGLHQRFGA